MQFIVYTKKGDAMTMAIVGQIRSLLSGKGLTAQVQLVDDPNLLATVDLGEAQTAWSELLNADLAEDVARWRANKRRADRAAVEGEEESE